MEISGVNAQPSNPVFSGAKKAEAVKEVAPQTQNVQPDKVVSQEQQVQDVQRTERQRLDTVVRAASQFKNTYAVSDTTFSIFKDSSGQFVTRFTSLKDGSVTYIPEPDIERFIASNNARHSSANISIDV
ncbi:MAG: hypothetical protein P8P30_00510 [Rickettsiales bacterium]|nr:hypothetical protein [Rickettsiales bacterium]